MLSLRRLATMRPAARVVATQMRQAASSANGGVQPSTRPDPIPRQQGSVPPLPAEEHSPFSGNAGVAGHPRAPAPAGAAAAAAEVPPVIHLVVDAAAVQVACAKLGQAAQLCVDIEALRYVAPEGEEEPAAAAAAATSAGRLGRISTVQVMGVSQNRMVAGAAAAGAPEVFVFDVLSLGAAAVAPALRTLLGREDQLKLLYDFRGDFVALDSQLGVALPRQSTLDVQLMCVAQRWARYGAAGRPSLSAELRRLLTLSERQLEAVAAGRLRMEEDGGGGDGGGGDGCEAWEVRPMPADLLAYAASGVLHLPALWMATLAHHEHAKELTRRTRAALLRGTRAAAAEEEAAAAAAASGRPHAVSQELLLETVGPAGACPTCKQPGHTPDRCRMGKICDFCGAAGHVKADCFKWRAAVESGGGEAGAAVPVRPLLVCDYCGATGHDEAHCFKKTKQVCEHCGEPGHRASTCRHIVPCAKCGELGHVADACPSDAKDLRGVEPSREKVAGGTRVLVCTFCGGRGHDAQHCFKRLKTKCAHCGETGHTEKTCRHIVPCTHCGAVGHIPKKCPQLAGGVPAGDAGRGSKACDKEAA